MDAPQAEIDDGYALSNEYDPWREEKREIAYSSRFRKRKRPTCAANSRR
jgi:hypothetical protein